jgi:hypothetical protein
MFKALRGLEILEAGKSAPVWRVPDDGIAGKTTGGKP